MADDDPAQASPEFHLDEALRAFLEAEKAIGESGPPRSLGTVAHEIARVHELAGRPADALESYRAAAEHRRRDSDLSYLPATLVSLATLLIDTGCPDEAEEILDEACDVLARVDLHRADRADHTHRVGQLFEMIGTAATLVKALDTYAWALELVDRDRFPADRLLVMLDIGDAQHKLGRLPEAAATFENAAVLARRLGSYEPRAWTSLGRVHIDLATPAAAPAADGTDTETDGPVSRSG